MPLHPPKPLSLKPLSKVFQIFNNFGPSLVGCWLTSLRRHLSIPPQYFTSFYGYYVKEAFRSPDPAFNIFRRNEDVACDIVYSDIPAIFYGSTAAVIFVGTSTKVTDFMVLNTIVNLPTPSKTTLYSEVLLIAYKVTVTCATYARENGLLI
jgi:hypothetical protein